MPDPLSKTAFAGDCQGSACELTVARDLAVHVAFDQLHYQAVDLGVVDGGWWSTGGFITRQSGIVVGTWGGSNPRAFFWDGAMSDFNFGFASVSIAGYADGGLVAGNYAVTMPGTFRPFRLRDGVLRDLDLLPGGSNGMATRMNSRGTVVGYVNIGYGAGLPRRGVARDGADGSRRARDWRGAGVGVGRERKRRGGRPGFRPARCGV